MHNKGFTMIEMLISIFILTILTSFTLDSFKIVNFEHLEYVEGYINAQIDSILNAKRSTYQSIHFKENGNVSNAKTIIINNHSYVSELGSGRLVQK